MHLAVVGSRGLSVSVEMVLAELQAVKVDIDSIDTVISGGAVGVDSVADELADRVGAAVRIHVPDYDRHGHRAPFIRNKDIVKQADFVLAFWDGESRGTAHALRLAVSHGIPCKIVRISSSLQLSLF